MPSAAHRARKSEIGTRPPFDSKIQTPTPRSRSLRTYPMPACWVVTTTVRAAELVGVDRRQRPVDHAGQAPVEDEPHGAGLGEALAARGQPRVVRAHRARPDRDRGEQPAPAVDVRPRRLARDPLGLARARGDPPVERRGKLSREERRPRS